MCAHYIGVDVGGTKIAYGLYNERRELLNKYKFPSDPALPAQAFADLILGHIDDILAQNALDKVALGGVGICMPSFIDFDKGYIVHTANLPLLRDFAARDYFEQRLGTRVMLDNDGNAAALAEHRYGAGRGNKHIIYCAVSTGLSSGIIINNHLFRGTYGWAGETGHMVADVDTGDDFESHASGGHIVERLAQKIRDGHPSVMEEMCGGELDSLTAFHLEDAYKQGDELAIWGLDHMGLYMGTWLYNLYLSFNVACFVLGGGLTKMGDMLFGRVRRVFDNLKQDNYPVQIKFAELGQDFGITGAVELLFDSGE